MTVIHEIEAFMRKRMAEGRVPKLPDPDYEALRVAGFKITERITDEEKHLRKMGALLIEINKKLTDARIHGY
jgi:hypothetical protein